MHLIQMMPINQHHLYEMHTAPQSDLVRAVLSGAWVHLADWRCVGNGPTGAGEGLRARPERQRSHVRIVSGAPEKHVPSVLRLWRLKTSPLSISPPGCLSSMAMLLSSIASQ